MYKKNAVKDNMLKLLKTGLKLMVSKALGSLKKVNKFKNLERTSIHHL